jgi:hypothetical protein
MADGHQRHHQNHPAHHAAPLANGLWEIFFAGWWYVSFNHIWGLGFGETWPALLVAWGIGMLLRPLLDNIFARPRSKHENPPRTQSRHADDHRAVRHRHRHAVLLDNLGWLDLDLRMHILPTVLIGAGILKAMQTRTQSGVVIGGLMIVAGCLILLKEMG